jgi:hypothetical protein
MVRLRERVWIGSSPRAEEVVRSLEPVQMHIGLQLPALDNVAFLLIWDLAGLDGIAWDCAGLHFIRNMGFWYLLRVVTLGW